jgi:hypothetical protein
MYLRLRIAHRLRLLGPLLRFERRIETWAARPPVLPRATLNPAPRHQE